ncbi:MAG: hypothetical protein ACLSH6_08135 [Limosilactobacillus pontis]
MATSSDQVPVTALERSLFAHLQSLCGPLDFTISGLIGSWPSTTCWSTWPARTVAGSNFYSPKVGWTTANLAADREALDHNEAIQKLIAGWSDRTGGLAMDEEQVKEQIKELRKQAKEAPQKDHRQILGRAYNCAQRHAAKA